MSKVKTKIGIIGAGAIGGGVALFIEKALSQKADLFALADINHKNAKALQKRLASHPKVLDTDSLIRRADLIIETASVAAARYILEKAIKLKKDILILSVGALIEEPSVLKRAEKAGINIYIPSGAICATDAVGAFSLGKIKKITLTTRKPPAGLAGAEYLKMKRISLSNLKKERVIFEGSVYEAIDFFPKNINVAATLLLASSFANVKVCIKVDPKIKRNIHRIEIEAREGNLRAEVENVPSKLNPKTSTLAILSAQYALKKIFSSLKIGG